MIFSFFSNLEIFQNIKKSVEFTIGQKIQNYVSFLGVKMWQCFGKENHFPLRFKLWLDTPTFKTQQDI
jgi:hypothetical protein